MTESSYYVEATMIVYTTPLIEYQLNTTSVDSFPIQFSVAYDKVVEGRFSLYISYEVTGMSPVSNCCISASITDPLAEVVYMNIQGQYADYKLTWNSAPLFPG